jgi:putative nucleotidyltransferase with HDIG domain
MLKPSAVRPHLSGGIMAALGDFGAQEAATRGDVVAHETRVARTSHALAKSLGMSDRDAQAVALAARYHDVGKLKVPDAVLRKPGRLTDAEWVHMRRHAVDGAQMLAAVQGMPKVMVEVARYHHERYDGFGYERLRGEDIPFAARIVAIADVHDALLSVRDYKPPLDEDEALEIMAADAPSPATGRRGFDPVLIRRFVALRLGDPAFKATPERRAALSAFASSDPSLDLTPEARARVSFGADGSRLVHADIGGEPAVVAVKPDGSVLPAPDEPSRSPGL